MTQNQDCEAGSIIIGEGVRMSGKIEAPGTVLVNGVIDGDVAAQEICIGASGRVSGSLSAQNIDLAGQAG